jgi:hypothetical protein
MLSINRVIHWVAVMLLFVSILESHICSAEDKKLTPQLVVTKHLQSIGSPDILEKVQSRAIVGAAKVRFIQGGVGELAGQGQCAFEGCKLGIILRYTGLDYRGEHFAYDGEDVTVGRFLPGKISVLADFVNRYDGLIKEGLFGGALSLAWALRDFQGIKSRLKYKKAKISGHAVHALEYRPRRSLGDFRIMLFFDPETFRHIKTEYKLHIRAAMGGGKATSIGIERSDSYYRLSEEFADFMEVDGMTLPQRYTIGFSSEGQMRTFLGYWTFEAQQWRHNGQIDPNFFKALVY